MARNFHKLIRQLPHLLVLRPLVHLIFGLNVRGADNLPRRSPFVLAANHNSHLDILVLTAALPVRLIAGTHVVAAHDYFSRHRLLFALVNYLFQPVWVDRRSGGGGALEKMGAILDEGGSVLIFPEGTRGEAGRIAHFHEGVGKLVAERPDVPLLPVFLRGPERAMPRKAPVPLPVWQHVTFGPPQRLSGESGKITAELRRTLLALERSETASRHRRRVERPKGVVIAVLGIDGSGKSTLSRRLALELSADCNSCLIGDRLELFADGEPRAAEPLLKEKIRRWISSQAKDAKSLARYKIPKLTELLVRDALTGEAKRWYGPETIVMDGSPLLNMTAWSALYRPDMMSADFCGRAMSILTGRRNGSRELYREFRELKVMKRLGLTHLHLPDVVLFLDVDPAVSMERIEKRGEKMQVHETAEKLERLRNAYHLVVEAARDQMKLPAFIVEGDRDIESVAEEALRLVEETLAGSREREVVEE
jgi:1-acyl-sn-glycerol-3-phosphate acyltransferase